VQAFVDRGGVALFVPPRAPGNEELFGIRWTEWKESEEGISVETWRGDHDLLARTQSGAALPVGELRVRRHCGLAGEPTRLATLRTGDPLVARAVTNRGAAYFCATTANPGDSSLATDGVVLYVLVQRALAAGAAVLGNTRQVTAGDRSLFGPASSSVTNPANAATENRGGDEAKSDPPVASASSQREREAWMRVAGAEDAISTEYPYHQGVYLAGERLFAVNRAADEDHAPIMVERSVADLFRGLDFSRVDDEAGSAASLIQEIWRLFLASMMAALVVEAALCLPRAVRAAGGAS
jgi:hypothetical protein